MSRYAKTVVAVAIAALTVLASAITDDVVTKAEQINILLAALGALGVYAIPNKPPVGEPHRPDLSEQGYSVVELMVAAFFAVLIVFLLVRLL
jgi:hypothetical protein